MKRTILTVLAAIAAAATFVVAGGAWAQGKYVHANNSGYDNLDPHVVFDVGRAASRINFYDGLLSLGRQSAEDDPVAGGKLHVLARRQDLDLQAAQRREVPRRQRDHRRRRGLQHRAHAGDEEGRIVAVPAHHRAGQHQGARQVHGGVHAEGTVGHLPGHRAGNPGGQFQAGEEEREGRRLGPGVARQERGQHRLLQAEALRSGDRLRRRALQGAFRRLGPEGLRRDRVPHRAGDQHPRPGADQGRLPGHRRIPAL